MITRPKAYLGDSVYAEVQAGQLVLTVENGYGATQENGYGATQEIVLEPEVLTTLVEYLKPAGRPS